MKQEASKKSKKWLWLVLGLVLLLAVAGVVLALVFGGGNQGDADQDLGGRPDLYWNVARASYLDPETTLSIREPAADGLYYVTFAHDGEQVEYPVVDKKLVNYIDSFDVMGLTFDNEGFVVDVIDPKEIATEYGKNLFVQSISGNMLVANSSVAMNGMRFNINLNELTEIYDVTGTGEFEGVKIDASALQSMDTITVYANGLEEVTHIYLTEHPVESKVYWRATQSYSSATKETAREPDENGYYTLDFYCEGELVYFKTKDKTIANKVDSTSRYSCHFGFRFDEDGYIVEILDSAVASRSILACQRFDITEFDGQTFTATRLLTNDGSYYTGNISENTKIYDASYAADSEGRKGQAVESIQMGDRVCVWTDTSGNVVLIYVANRLVDSPAYYVPSRKYDSTLKQTKREPDSNGVYSIELLREGDSEKTTYYTTDKDLMTVIDADTDKCVGLKVDENNNIIYVYDPECLFGNSAFCRGRFVSEVTGTIFSSIVSSDPDNPKNGVLTPDCKIYNVSKVGEYGAETTLQVGDNIYAWKQPTGEIVHAYVTLRYIGEDTMYYNLETMYDSDAKKSTRVPDENGWYWFDMAYMGKQVRLKTKNLEFVQTIDSAAVGSFSLEVSGNVITAVYDAKYATGGSKIASGYRISSFNADGTITAVYKEKEVTFKLAEDVQVYNVSPVVKNYKGEKISVSDLKIGDMLTVYTNWTTQAKIIFVRQRYVDNMYWKLDRFYNSTDECTTRVPDENGWYYYDLAVNGEVKTLKTNDIKIANSMDKYEGAFGLHVVGDVIKGFVAVSSVRDCSGNGVSSWTVTAINGNKVTVTYTYSGSKSTGTSKTITLASNAKIYDVSDSATKWGSKTTLQVGDVIRTYLSRDGESHQYVYIRAHSTRKGGYMSYCDHCDKVVYWNPLIKNGGMGKYDNHYYLACDIENTSQITMGSKARDYENVLDLNGHTLTRVGGRAILNRYNDTLTIIDSVGGGKIVGNGSKANGGTIMMSSGAKLNLYAGTLTLTDDETVTPNYGGVVYMSGADCEFNMYGGTITGGRSYMQDDYDFARGGNLYVSAGTFNMYGGTISGGKAYNGEEPVFDENGNPVIVKKTQKQKMDVVRSYGGNIYVSTGGTLNITGGVITDGWAESYGGNIASTSTANKINLTGATVTDGVAGYRGGNLAASYGTWVIDGGTKITGGVAGVERYGNGGNIYACSANVTINKATVDGGKAVYKNSSSTGGNIYCLYNGSLTLNKGSVVSNGTSYGNGGNIYVAGNQYVVSSGKDRRFTLTLNGGTVTGGTSTAGHGGNICMSGYSTDINGDDVKEYVGGSYFYMLGGEISNGTCPDGKFGGNIYLQVDEAVISGGKIFGGMQGENEYDIYVPGDGKNITVSGGEVAGKFRVNSLSGVTVTGNPVLGQLNLAKKVIVAVGELKKGADIAVIVSNNPLSTPNANAQKYVDAGYITAYEDGKIVAVNENNELYITNAPLPTKTAYCEHCGKEVTWEAWQFDGGEKIGTGGHYYLHEDLELTSQYGIGTSTSDTADDAIELCLDLNGHNIDSTRAVFYVYPYSSLSIQGEGNVSGTGTAVKSKPRSGGVFYLEGYTSLDIYGGTYTMSESDVIGNGGVIYGGSNSVINIHSGTFNGSAMLDGYYGGIIYSKAAVKVSSGTFNGGTCDYGSVIFMAGATTELTISDAVMNGQVYLNNEAASISLSGSVQITDLYLRNGNVATVTELAEGSNIVVNAPGKFAETDKAASEYVAYFSTSKAGMEIVANGNALSVTEVEITDPNAVTAYCEHCGADAQWSKWELFSQYGSGHYYLTDDMILLGGTEYNIPAGKDVILDLKGLSITAEAGRAFTVEGTLSIVDSGENGMITGSAPTNGVSYGGVIYMTTEGAVFNLYGGTLKMTETNNSTAGGGVIYVKNSTFNMYGGELAGGESYGDASSTNSLTRRGRGGNLYANNGTVNLMGGKIHSGIAGVGGNIYTGTNSTLVLSGTEVTGGEAKYTGGNIYSESGTLTISGGSVTGGTVSADSASSDRTDGIYLTSSNLTVNITGGTLNGKNYIHTVKALNISGEPVVDRMVLKSGVKATLGTMSGNASIKVAADGVFTEPVSNASDYLAYFSAYTSGKKVAVTSTNELTVVDDSGSGETEPSDPSTEPSTDPSEPPVDPADTPNNDVYAAAVQQTAEGVFASGETVTATCPYCGESANWSVLESGAAATLSAGHYYLAGDLENTGSYTVSTGSVCLHLNGHNITTTGNRVFYIEKAGTLNVMGDGQVCGSFKANSEKPYFAATIDSIGFVNLCGGTWLNGGKGPILGGRGTSVEGIINIYEGTTIDGKGTDCGYALVSVFNKTTLNMYGGTITGGVNASGNGGNICIKAGSKSSYTTELNIYGGTIENGSAAQGGNIHATGGTGVVNVNIAGGTITGGSVYVDKLVSSLAVSGKVTIDDLDLSDGTLVTLGTMGENASVKVTASGVFTEALTNANDYLTYISAAQSGSSVVVNSDNTLSVKADSGAGEETQPSEETTAPTTPEEPQVITAHCEHCDADVEWTPFSEACMEVSTANVSKKLKQGGHYYLADDFTMEDGYQLNIGSSSDAEQMFCLELNGNTWTGTFKGFLVYGIFNIQDSSEDETGCIVTTGNGKNAGVMQIQPDAVVSLYSGTLKQAANSTLEYGGIMTLNGTFNMYGGTLTDAVTTADGGAIKVNKASSVLNISGGKITNCSSGDANGSAIYAANGTVTISGGTIEGEVFLTSTTVSAEISGDAVIEALASNVKVTFGELKEGAAIGIKESAGNVFSNPCENAKTYIDAGYITSAVANYQVAVDAENCMYLTEMICPCGCGLAVSAITWTQWSDSLITDSKYIPAGHYFLAEDYTTEQYLVVGTSSDNTTNVVIDLRGNSWTNTAGRAFTVYGTLSVMDTVGGGQIAGSSTDNGGTMVIPGGTLNLHSGTLTVVENNASSYGGVLSITRNNDARATFNMTGGKITGGNSVGSGSNKGRGGNVYMAYTDFTMTGGIITGGNSTGTGGNVHGLSNSTANITGGIISGGNAGTRGGNIYLESGTYTISNCTVTGGTATNQGDDICTASPNTVLTLTDTVVSGELNLRDCNTVTVAGKTQIGQVTYYTNGAVLTLGELTSGASIKFAVDASAAVTAACDNAQAYIDAGILAGYDESIALSVVDGAVYANVGITTG